MKYHGYVMPSQADRISTLMSRHRKNNEYLHTYNIANAKDLLEIDIDESL